MPSNSPTTPIGLGVHEQFRPQRAPGSGLVLGGGAPGEVSSVYNRLRTQIMRRLQENHWNTVAITSPSRSSGNTLTAINLALSIARDFNHTVLLVELNLINPSFSEVLRSGQRPGIADHLLRDVPIAEILFNPGIDRLAVIPAGSAVANSSELLSSARMIRLVEDLRLRDEHQIALFDLPPVLAVDDATAFSPLVDCALLVVEEGVTRVSDVRLALEYLKPTKILGVVLNRSTDVENDGN
jgi:protein-tyrosine kinase